MKLPPSHSNQRKIVNLLLQGLCISPQEGIDLHGTLRLTLAEIAELYRDLVVRGCAVEVGPRIAASPALLEKYGLIEITRAPARPPAPSREPTPFRPLDLRRLPSSRGMRPGSNDLRGLPSHYGNCRPKETA